MTRQAGQTRGKRDIRWRVLFVLLPLAGVLCMGVLFFAESLVMSRGLSFIPVDLRSALEANYNRDTDLPRIPGVRLDLIWEVIHDREPGATDVEARKALLLSSLQTPVPFVAPQACHGIHTIYASQDTWCDSGGPRVVHGNDTALHVARVGEQNTSRVLLYFPASDSVPPGTFIAQARLEMDVPEGLNPACSEPLIFWNLVLPFQESTADWSNQPEPQIHYRAVALARTDIQAWDVTDLVRDWLLEHHQYNGIVLDPRSCHEQAADYLSPNVAGHEGGEIAPASGGSGPRLVINCGAYVPRSQGVAAATPTAGGDQPSPARASEAAATASTPLSVPSRDAATGMSLTLPSCLIAGTRIPPSAPVGSRVSAARQSGFVLPNLSPCGRESCATGAH